MEPDSRAAGQRSTEQRSDTNNFVARSCAEQPEARESGGEHGRNQRRMDEQLAVQRRVQQSDCVTMLNEIAKVAPMSGETNVTGSPNSQPTVGQSFKTGNRGEKLFEDWLPDDWIHRKQQPDFFVDYVVEIVEKGEPTGCQFAAQVKGIKIGKKSAIPLKYAAKGKHARYWLHKCQHPVFFFLIDTESRAGHWLFAQKFLRERVSKVALEKQKTITLHLDPADDLVNKERFFSALRDAEKYVKDLHPGSIQAALEKTRRELERKEPRLSYKITASEGVQTIQLSAKEPFPVRILIDQDHAKEVNDSIARAMDQGGMLKLAMAQIRLAGSPLFDEFNGKANAELVLQFGEKIPGSITMQAATAGTAINIHIDGSYLVGSKRATFRGGLLDAPLSVECAIPLPATPDASLSFKLGHPLERWYGQPVQQLAYFEQIASITEYLQKQGKVQTEIFCRGNLLVTGQIGAQESLINDKISDVFTWLRRCRAVAERYGIDPRLPDLSKVTNDEWDAVDDLFGLLAGGKMTKKDPGLSAKLTISGPTNDQHQFPMSGCIRFDHQDAVIHLLGEAVHVGSLRTFYTNVRVDLLSVHADGSRVMRLKGSDSTLRILERF
jgi:hypothetical protein